MLGEHTALEVGVCSESSSKPSLVGESDLVQAAFIGRRDVPSVGSSTRSIALARSDTAGSAPLVGVLSDVAGWSCGEAPATASALSAPSAAATAFESSPVRAALKSTLPIVLDFRGAAAPAVEAAGKGTSAPVSKAGAGLVDLLADPCRSGEESGGSTGNGATLFTCMTLGSLSSSAAGPFGWSRGVLAADDSELSGLGDMTA